MTQWMIFTWKVFRKDAVITVRILSLHVLHGTCNQENLKLIKVVFAVKTINIIYEHLTFVFVTSDCCVTHCLLLYMQSQQIVLYRFLDGRPRFQLILGFMRKLEVYLWASISWVPAVCLGIWQGLSWVFVLHLIQP